MCALALPLTACGGDDDDDDGASSSFCEDYLDLQGLSGTDEETLRRAADLYRKLADEAPASAKDDLNTVADAEDAVADGDAASVDEAAVSAAADRADAIAQETCGNG